MPWSPRLEVNEWFYGLQTDWRRQLKAAGSPAQATRSIVKAHASSLRFEPARSIFWLMLAHYQCLDGCLQSRVKRSALAIIGRGAGVVLWLDTSAGTPARRQADFERLRRELMSSKPARATRRRSG